MIAVLDQVQTPGRAPRALQYDADAELTTAGSGDGTYALLPTNRGQLECDIGTMAIRSDGAKIKWLTTSGWQDLA